MKITVKLKSTERLELLLGEFYIKTIYTYMVNFIYTMDTSTYRLSIKYVYVVLQKTTNMKMKSFNQLYLDPKANIRKYIRLRFNLFYSFFINILPLN